MIWQITQVTYSCYLKYGVGHITVSRVLSVIRNNSTASPLCQSPGILGQFAGDCKAMGQSGSAMWLLIFAQHTLYWCHCL